MTSRIVLNAMQLLPIVLVGFLLPWMGRSRRGLLFGVTVTVEFADSAVAAAALRRYRHGALAVAVLVTLACVAAMVMQSGLAIAPVALVLELIAVMALWQRERRGILPHAVVVPLERTASLRARHDIGIVLATAASALPVLATALWLRSHWEQIPERWPRHWNAMGQVNGWGIRTMASVYFPLLMGAAVVLLFVSILAFLVYAPGAQSRERSRIFAPMAALAWSTTLLFCAIALQPLFHITGTGPIVIVIVLHMAVTVGIVIWLVLRSGFMEANNTSQPAIEPYDGTPDAHWYGGVFYYNPGDAAVLVPKRYGWGWTLNFARPAAWVFTLLIVGFAVGSALLPKMLR